MNDRSSLCKCWPPIFYKYFLLKLKKILYTQKSKDRLTPAIEGLENETLHF